MNLKRDFLLIGLIAILPLASLNAQVKKALELTDLMKFRQIQSPSISEDGKWVTHSSVPDRGDPEVAVYSTSGKEKYLIPLGKNPVISANGKWVAAVHAVPAGKLLKVKSFTFSNDGRWLISLRSKEAGNSKNEKGEKENGSRPGSTLQLLSLEKGIIDTLEFVTSYALDSLSQHLA